MLDVQEEGAFWNIMRDEANEEHKVEDCLFALWLS